MEDVVSDFQSVDQFDCKGLFLWEHWQVRISIRIFVIDP